MGREEGEGEWEGKMEGGREAMGGERGRESGHKYNIRQQQSRDSEAPEWQRKQCQCTLGSASERPKHAALP